MSVLLILPVVLPMTTALMCLLAAKVTLQRWISTAGAAALLTAGMGLLVAVSRTGIQSVGIGSWPAPFGIVLVADLFSALMTAVAGAMGLAVAVYSIRSIDGEREALGYHSLLHLLLMGVSGAFLTGDIFNLYVWFEVMLIASFVLLTLGGSRAELEGGIKYVTLNLLSSAIFLSAIGVTYGVAGTLNMADLARQFQQSPQPELEPVLITLFVAAFGIKAAAFPFFCWLPASYHTPPVAVTTLFSALLTKVGVYSLVRVLTLLFHGEGAHWQTPILVMAGLTMVTGVLGAVVQMDFRRLLSFHIVSQIGYLLMGVGLFTRLALAAVVFFMVHVIVAKSALFLVSGITARLSGTEDLKKLGGFYRSRPLLAILFLAPALALAGLPPLSGFWAKFGLIRAGVESGQFAMVTVALVVSLFTLYSMTKIWGEVFWKDSPQQVPPSQARPPSSMLLPAASLAAFTFLLGVVAEPLFSLSSRAADQLANPQAYISAVLGDEVR